MCNIQDYANYRNQKNDEGYTEIEALIFMRDYPNAFERATKLVEKYILDGKMKETEALLSLCNTESRVKPSSYLLQKEL